MYRNVHVRQIVNLWHIKNRTN